MGEQVGALEGLECEAEDVVDGYEGAGGVGRACCVWEMRRASVGTARKVADTLSLQTSRPASLV